MTDLIRPYADLEGIFDKLEYRANPVAQFETIEIDGDSATTIVPVDDLRAIPQHELRLQLNLDVLKPHYQKHKDKLHLVIITRDTTLRREVRLCDYSLDELPAVISLDRGLLRTTALRDTLPLSICVVLNERLKGESAFPTQRSSRLVELDFVIRNSSGGAAFPFKRVSAEQLKEAGLPTDTGVRLELICDPVELIDASDTPIANLLQVWVHEKVWAAIQNDRSPTSAKLRMTAVTLSAAHLILAAVVPLLKGQQLIREDSVVGQLLSHLEEQASLPEGRLRRDFQSDPSLIALDPYLQHAWRFAQVAGKVEDEVENAQ
jgi:hypothetical protein